MMGPIFLAAAFGRCACTAANTSAPAAAPVPAFPAISVDTLKTVTQTLSSDAFEGRAPATPAEEKTVSYIAAQFEAAGLKPGNGESWYQDVPLVELKATSKPAPPVPGGAQHLTLAYPTDMIAGTRPAVPPV